MIAGCATIEIDESAGTYKYSRTGNQELIDVEIIMDRDPTGVIHMEARLGKQDSDAEIAEIVRENAKILKMILERIPKIPGILP